MGVAFGCLFPNSHELLKHHDFSTDQEKHCLIYNFKINYYFKFYYFDLFKLK